MSDSNLGTTTTAPSRAHAGPARRSGPDAPRARLRVLLIHDGDLTAFRGGADPGGPDDLEWSQASDMGQALQLLHAGGVDAIVLDLSLVGEIGLSAFARIYAVAPDTPIVVLGPAEHEPLLMRAVHQGARDYLVTDQLHPTLVRRTIRHAIERQLNERERRASETRYREIFDQSTDAIVLCRSGGEIVDANPAFVELTGVEREEVRAHNVLEFCQRRTAALRIAVALRAAHCVQHVEVAVRTSSGERRDCLASVRLRAGPEGGYLATLHDVTRRKEAEAELRRTQEQFWMAQKMEAVGRLAGGLAHDFNNLLGVIGGSAELALMDVREGRVDEEDIREIIKAADHAAALTRQLLAFSRKQVLQPRTLDLNQLILESATMLQRVMRENIAIVTRLDPHLAAVKADPSQLHQVLMNIAVNASDAMPMGGQLTIRTANAELSEGSGAGLPHRVVPGRYVALELVDTGSGMAETTREHVFEPFFTTKKPGAGTGLGLATVYGIVKQSGGYIWVDSAPDQGTTFRIYLPGVERSTPVPDGEPVRRRVDRIRGATVLLVEDEPAMRTLITRTLERAGYRVLAASDYDGGMELAKRATAGFEILLTDVILPGRSGHALAQRLLETDPGLRVLFMSGHPHEEIARHGALEEGVNLIDKPFKPDQLLERLRAVLGGEDGAAAGVPGTH